MSSYILYSDGGVEKQSHADEEARAQYLPGDLCGHGRRAFGDLIFGVVGEKEVQKVGEVQGESDVEGDGGDKEDGGVKGEGGVKGDGGVHFRGVHSHQRHDWWSDGVCTPTGQVS